MNTLELKGGLYDMIARVNDKDLLAQIHGLISQMINQNIEKTDFWDDLSSEQQNELELAIEESFNEKNLISNKAALDQIQGWLKTES